MDVITTMEILTTIGGLMLGVVSYFLRRTMNEIEKIKEVAYENRSQIMVMRNDYINKIDALNDKFDLLANSIKELNSNIKELNNKLIK
jgi:ascorbate-specific PTS system EIIC-type component UlaA